MTRPKFNMHGDRIVYHPKDRPSNKKELIGYVDYDWMEKFTELFGKIEYPYTRKEKTPITHGIAFNNIKVRITIEVIKE